MNALLHNFKFYYQKRWMYLIYLIFIPHILSHVTTDKLPNLYSFFFLIAFAGVMATVLQIEVMSKPFSYLLPQHRKIKRTFLIATGIIVSFIMSLLFISKENMDLSQKALLFGSTFSHGLCVFYFGMLFNLIDNVKMTVKALLIILFFVISISWTLNVDIIILFLKKYPLTNIFSGLLATIICWKYLENNNIARLYFGRVMPNIYYSSPSRQKPHNHSEAIAKSVRNNPCDITTLDQKWFEFIQNHISNYKAILSGSLYTLIKLNSMLKGRCLFTFIVITIMVMLEQHLQSTPKLTGPINIFTCFLFCIMAFIPFKSHPPIYSSLMLPSGRKEKFISTLILAWAYTFFWMIVFIFSMSLYYGCIQPLVPLIADEFTPNSFTIDRITLLLIPLTAIPLGFIIKIMTPRYSLLWVLPAFILPIFPISEVLADQHNFDIMKKAPAVVLLTPAIIWGLYYAILKRKAMKGNLAF